MMTVRTKKIPKRKICTVWLLALTGLVMSFETIPKDTPPIGNWQTSQDGTPSRRLLVAPGRELSAPSMAARVARDGDVIEIAAGVYQGDAATWTQNNLTIRGVGGSVDLQAAGAHAEGKAIWVIKGNNVVIENVSFSGARVPDRNGAGIRLEGNRLRLSHCLFRGNENGILTSVNPLAEILIEHSEFGSNGNGSGQTHNIYVGGGRSLTIRYSYIHNAIGGHGVKSRAAQTDIRYNLIADDFDGATSYEVEFPNGGLAILVGNVIRQAPTSKNPTMVSYGVEGLRHSLNELYAVHNTFINDRSTGRFFHITRGTTTARLINNIYSGAGPIATGSPPEIAGSVMLGTSDFVNAAGRDYRPREGVQGLQETVPPGGAHGSSFAPVSQYLHPRSYQPRGPHPTLDAGALDAIRQRLSNMHSTVQ